ncbi:MAG: hypothetical protein ACQETJ_05690, partial [Bacteroidota bacterium]
EVAGNESLKPATGENRNPFFETPEIKKPLISEAAELNPVTLAPTNLYDIQTEKGKTYILKYKQ